MTRTLSNPPSDMARTAKAASVAAIFAYDLEDFLRVLKSRDGRRRSVVVQLDRKTWASFWREQGEDPRATEKAWERWKDKIEGIDVGRKTGTELFEFNAEKAADWIERTIQRGLEIAEAYKQATGSSVAVLRAPELDVDRDLTAAEVARRLGVEVHAIYRWVETGAPHARLKGTKGFGTLVFNEAELRAWLAGRMDESRRIASHHEVRVPVEEASRRLVLTRDALGLTTWGFARLLEVSPWALRSWIRKDTDTAPASVLAAADLMLEERGIDPRVVKPAEPEARIPQTVAAPRLKAVREALNMSSAVLAQELGVPTVTLKSWLGTGGKVAETVPLWAVEGAEGLLKTTERRIYKSSSSKLADPKLVREAFKKAHGSPSKAAEILGVVPSAAKLAADRLGIETTKRVDLSEVISEDELRASLKRHAGSAAAAARELGTDRPSVTRLAGRYGLTDLVRRREAIIVDCSALREAVARLGSVRAAAAELGLSVMTALRRAKSCGIEAP